MVTTVQKRRREIRRRQKENAYSRGATLTVNCSSAGPPIWFYRPRKRDNPASGQEAGRAELCQKKGSFTKCEKIVILSFHTMVYLPTEAAKYEDFAKLSPYYQLAMANSRELMGFLKQQSGIDIPNGMEFDPLWVLAPIAKPGGKDEIYSVETKQIVQKNKDGTETEKTVFQYYSATSNPEHGNYVKNDSGEFLKISRPLTDAEKEDPYNEGRAELQAYIHFSQYYGPNEVAKMYFSILQMVLAITLQIFMTAQSQMEDYLEEAEEINQKISQLQNLYNRLNSQKINSMSFSTATGEGSDRKDVVSSYVQLDKALALSLRNFGFSLPDREVITGLDVTPYLFCTRLFFENTWGGALVGLPMNYDRGIKVNDKNQAKPIIVERCAWPNIKTTKDEFDKLGIPPESKDKNDEIDWDKMSPEEKEEEEKKRMEENKKFKTLLTANSIGGSQESLMTILNQNPKVGWPGDLTGVSEAEMEEESYLWMMAFSNEDIFLPSASDRIYVFKTRNNNGMLEPVGNPPNQGYMAVTNRDPGNQFLFTFPFDPKSFMDTRIYSDIMDDDAFADDFVFYIDGGDLDVLMDAIRSKIDSWNIRIQVPTNAISSMSSEVSQIFQTGTELISRVGERWKQVAQSLR